SECMNPADEEWSEDEVIKLLQADHGLPSAEIVLRVMAAADAFANGAKQHDDMTLIVMKASA
ncbi:MAG: SpoIIE family protein phosphatase, partial [Vicinamibacteria bacterium]